MRVSDEQREALLDAYETSGLSGPQFAAQHGVNYQTFATWLQKRRRARGLHALGLGGEMSFSGLASALPELAEVELSVPEIPGARAIRHDDGLPLEIRFSCGARVAMHRMGQAGLLAALLNAMAKEVEC